MAKSLIMDAQTLRTKLSETPESIRTWFGSESVVTHISDVNGELGLKDEQKKTIPRLILRIEIQDLEPQFFSGELANELGLDKTKAQIITTKIKKSVFEPIKNKLIDYGIDINLLDRFEIPPFSAKKIKKETGFVVLERIGEQKTLEPTFVPIITGAETTKKPLEGAPFDITQGKPLIIHKEEPETEEREKPFKGFGFPLDFLRPEKPISEPIKVKIEGPSGETQKPKKESLFGSKQEKRIVNYSELRTPLTSFGQPEADIINLETFIRKEPAPAATPITKPALTPEIPKTTVQTIQPKIEAKPATKPAATPPALPPSVNKNDSQTIGPKLKGNIIDLS